MKRVNVQFISVKDFHLPLNSTPEKIQEVLKQFADAGIKVYTLRVIYMKTKEAVDEAFAYTQKVGVPMIVGLPNTELLDYTEEKVKATGIKIAIHNHGPEDKLSWTKKYIRPHQKPRQAYGHLSRYRSCYPRR